ncbi:MULTISPECIES: thiamine biosynthesis protein ThiF [unclassified Mesorhizobium]|uniref:thiamine biosynthesis protein ThiF n=1 Tax=unclassified Mesorhizobium TaxID=325217 RepID=UPI00112A9A06|nr:MULTISPECIES: thiamine biosynthesis protein ThiF [unclassified Mesorhizobium]MBZ9810896.1 ThiF family adenylyltransferase [Mesorhizobium sp. ESP-6-2]TPM27694.1 thiamine biosynthesis protein ThiF [Mesorhizobium sp. B2-2-2]
MMTQMITETRPDTLHRGVKMALDNGEADSVEAGYALFASYRMAIGLGAAGGQSPAIQAALLTMVNCGRRALLGGVEILGDLQVPLLVDLPRLGATLGDAVVALGGTPRPESSPLTPLTWLGDGAPSTALQVSFSDWRGGVFVASEGERLAEGANDIPAAVLAGALAVAEVFQRFRGNPMAGDREVGLSLWDPCAPWRSASGPAAWVAPSKLWVLGLGHLGQAFLWTLGLLPFERPTDVEVTLQDFDRLALANDSTSILTRIDMAGRLKTREMAAWAEARGFRTRVVERRFAGDITLAEDDPRVLFCGVDNAEARASLEDPGFDLVVDAGLGAGPQEYLAMRLHTFPGPVAARARWGEVSGTRVADTKAAKTATAYQNLLAKGLDDCGLLEIASRTVGVPFVGVIAATLALMEIVRRLNHGPCLGVLDLTLRDIGAKQDVEGKAAKRFNPGYTTLRA